MKISGIPITFATSGDNPYRSALKDSKKFSNWIDQIQTSFIVKEVLIHKIHMFGSKVGFVDAEAIASDFNGNNLPGIAFIRGESVAILVTVLNVDTNETFFVFTRQARVPAGDYILEAPAGMLDDSSNITSKAIEELEEEIGVDLDFKSDKLQHLTSGFASPGGSDEWISIYSYELELSNEEIEQLNGRATGSESENEHIELVVVSVSDAIERSSSLITQLAIQTFMSNKMQRLLTSLAKNQ